MVGRDSRSGLGTCLACVGFFSGSTGCPRCSFRFSWVELKRFRCRKQSSFSFLLLERFKSWAGRSFRSNRHPVLSSFVVAWVYQSTPAVFNLAASPVRLGIRIAFPVSVGFPVSVDEGRLCVQFRTGGAGYRNDEVQRSAMRLTRVGGGTFSGFLKLEAPAPRRGRPRDETLSGRVRRMERNCEDNNQAPVI